LAFCVRYFGEFDLWLTLLQGTCKDMSAECIVIFSPLGFIHITTDPVEQRLHGPTHTMADSN
jgi:predicted kinase